jgi:thiosulfate/3-mercaptopyruvate sulfurtransferase
MALDTLVDVDTLAAHLDDPGWRVVDCRYDLADTGQRERDYASAHVPGAWYAHLSRDLSGPITPSSGRHPLPEPAQLCEWLGERAIVPGEQVVAYDDSGGSMAVRLWWLLRWLGYRNVAVLDGGWQAWTAAGLPTSSLPPDKPAATSPNCLPDSTLLVETAELVDWVHQPDPSLTLIDARAEERFAGRVEPLDTVAGHVPGAINIPLTLNLASDGRFRSTDALRELYLSQLNGRNAASVVAMCGSGVTACHNLLAMAIAGLPVGRLYAGSWSEWIRDPARAVATSAD